MLENQCGRYDDRALGTHSKNYRAMNKVLKQVVAEEYDKIKDSPSKWNKYTTKLSNLILDSEFRCRRKQVLLT